jgi:hypothetical protein
VREVEHVLARNRDPAMSLSATVALVLSCIVIILVLRLIEPMTSLPGSERFTHSDFLRYSTILRDLARF